MEMDISNRAEGHNSSIHSPGMDLSSTGERSEAGQSSKRQREEITEQATRSPPSLMVQMALKLASHWKLHCLPPNTQIEPGVNGLWSSYAHFLQPSLVGDNLLNEAGRVRSEAVHAAMEYVHSLTSKKFLELVSFMPDGDGGVQGKEEFVALLAEYMNSGHWSGKDASVLMPQILASFVGQPLMVFQPFQRPPRVELAYPLSVSYTHLTLPTKA